MPEIHQWCVLALLKRIDGYMVLILLTPVLLASCVCVAVMLIARKRLGVGLKALLPGFFGHVVGWGVFITVPLLVVAILTSVVMHRQSPLLPFVPWTFAAGQIVGLMRWQSKHKKNRPSPQGK
jgi:hypothetical protein